MSGEGKVVCVTGASGFIASWLVKLLLQRGYTVKATVRDPNNDKAEHLLTLDGAKERLHLFKTNLLEDGSFDCAVDGCEGVFHTASPAVISANDPQHWYAISKTLAEQAAWKFAEENGIDLVTIHPGLVLGPFLQPYLNFSVEVFLKLIQGYPTYPSPYRLIDVRDVAFAHIQALEVPIANGRYMMVGRVTHDYEILKFLRQNYPSLHLPEKSEDYKSEPTYHVSEERAKSLGINYMPWELSVKDTIESLKEKGFLHF